MTWEALHTELASWQQKICDEVVRYAQEGLYSANLEFLLAKELLREVKGKLKIDSLITALTHELAGMGFSDVQLHHRRSKNVGSDVLSLFFDMGHWQLGLT